MTHIDAVKKQRHPEERANFISKITFFWLLDLFKFGHIHQITINDIYGVRHDDTSAKLLKKISMLWKKECNSLWWVIKNMYGYKLVISGLGFSFVDTFCRLIQPQFMGAFINFFTPNQADISEEQAFYYAVGTILCTFIPILVFHPFFLYVLNIGQRIRIACCSLLYKKALKTSKNLISSQQLDTQIMNLISRLMTENFDLAVATSHEIYRAPLEAFFIVIFIYKEIGIAGLFGIILMFAFVPLLFYIVKKISVYRSRVTHQTEKRVNLMKEIISNIAAIKSFCMEQLYAKMIKCMRSKEIGSTRGILYLRATLISFNVLPKLSIFVCIVSVLNVGNDFSAKSIYVIIAYYNMLFTSMLQFWPLLMTNAKEACKILEKIRQLLLKFDDNFTAEENIEDMKLMSTEHSDNKKKSQHKFNENSDVKGISIRNIVVDEFNLKCDYLEMIEGQSYAFVDSSHSSKFLPILLGEVQLDSGEIEFKGSISYASRNSWIFTGSIRDNILFTEKFEYERYLTVLKICEIDKELDTLLYGDETLIDEFNMNESFKGKISLARCLYRDADIYLIENIFDTKIMKISFHEILKDKISLIVTENLDILTQATEIITVKNNSIELLGTLEDLCRSNIFETFILKNVTQEKWKIVISTTSEVCQQARDESMHKSPFAAHQEHAENKISENVEWNSYKRYFKTISSSKCRIVWLMILFLFAQLNSSILELIISKWINCVNFTETSTNKEQKRNDGNNSCRENEAFASNYYNWVNFVYFYLIILCTLLYFTIHRSFLFFKLCIRASVKIHDRLFCAITRATLRFFQCNSMRNILNNFALNVETMDVQLPVTIYDSTTFLFEIIGIFSLIAYVNYWLLLPTFIMLFVIHILRYYYVNTSRSLQSVESLTHNSIYSRIKSTFQGLSTINLTHSKNALMEEFHKDMNMNTSTMYLNLAATRAFAFWLDIICSLYICAVIFIFLLFKSEDIESSYVGMAITQALHLPFFLQWGIRQTVEVGSQMTSVKEIFRYQSINAESSLQTPNKHRPIKVWPQNGKIVFKYFHLRYSNDVHDVLKNLNFKINPGEKIGIIGPKNSGKSSIIQALLRLAINEGTIEIDDINIDTLGLHDLRRSFGIIPSNPIIFNGSIRCNLDPFEQRTDEEIWNALERVRMKHILSDINGSLSAMANEQKFTIKQIQLLYVARALLTKSRILILDGTTDKLQIEDENEIQDVIRQNFSAPSTTIISIAKRLETIVDCDNIIVFDDGHIVEIGHPYELIQISRGYFRSLIDKTGLECSINLIKICEKNFYTKNNSS